MAKQTTKERLKAIQRRLGVEDDGLLGPTTLSRIEALLDQAHGAEATEPKHSLKVSQKGLEQIIQFEISSDAYYRRSLSRPVWPKGQSGITIGIGYDLGYNSSTQIKKEWLGEVPDADLAHLQDVAGLKGKAAQQVLAAVSDIRIPLDAAKKVFYTATLPKYAQMTKKAYPGVEKLPADAQTMLLSLVYNRGARMSGSSRREMKAIQPLVEAGDLNGIAEQIRLMKRLWDENVLRGLHVRRDKEAKMIASARQDAEVELIRV